MLSQKLQDDLMTAYQKVYEEKRGHAAGSDDTEKQASQLASDVRYKAKSKVPEGATEEERRKIFLQILSASPAPAVVKSMAKEKLLGEEVVNEVLGVVTATPKVMKKAQQVRARKNLIQNVKTKAKEYGEKAGRAIVGTTPAGKAVRIAAGGTAAYMMGRAGEADANINRSNTYRSLVKQDFKPQSTPKPLSSRAVKYEEVVHEMRFDDGDEGTKKRLKKLEKKRGMKMPDHPQFQTKKKDVKEGSAYGIYKGDGVMKIGKKEEEKAPRKQKGAMAYDGPNKERSEAADRVLAKTKKKREEKKKMKEEYVSEKMMAKKLMRKPIDPVNVATKAAGVAGAAGVGMAYKKTNESAGETIGEMKKTKSNPKNLKDMSKGAEQKAPVDYRTLAQSYSPVGNIFNEKKLDAVGAEDKDIDNDGDHDSTDKYLLKRRKAIGKAIAKKRGKVKEGFSAWRIDLDFNEQVKK